MKRTYIIIILVLISVFLSGIISGSDAAVMEDYCQVPPFITTAVPPNVLINVDVSGSMGWHGYNPDSSGRNACNLAAGCGHTFNGSEEGYFDPTRNYVYNAGGGYWEETAAAAVACPNREADISTANVYAGSCMNFNLMTRLDLVRWAITGGRPATCTGGGTPSNDRCDPDRWPETSGAGKVHTVCDATGCILLTVNGDQMKSPWTRLDDSLTTQFKVLGLKMNVGVMFYSGTGIRSDKVYIGDFTAPSSETAYPHTNLRSHINWTADGGYTPTGPAMWDAKHYFEQVDAVFGGFAPASGSADWKDPMFQCEDEDSDGICQGNEITQVTCGKNFVILMSDGQWNRGGDDPVLNVDACSIDDGSTYSADPVVPAYEMHMGFTNQHTSELTKISAIYSIGLFMGGTGVQSMRNIAMYGSFDNISSTWPGGTTGLPDDTCALDDCGAGKGSPCEPLPASSPDWDADSDGQPDTFHNAGDAAEIKTAIMDAIQDLLRRASSGTAASVLASSEGRGANLIQAVFFPKRVFDNDTEVDWTSEMYNLWYYIDPRLQNSSLREDTNQDYMQHLYDDYTIHYRFDSVAGKTLVDRFVDTDLPPDGIADTQVDTINMNELNHLWEAGSMLFQRDVSTSPRTLYTTLDGFNLTDFLGLDTNNATIRSYLQASTKAEADDIISYIHGVDKAGYRNRTVTIGATTGVWKLGDIITSTPKIQSSVNLNRYHEVYKDGTYKAYIKSNDYKSYGMAFAGANDGMLHAFKFGKFEVSWGLQDKRFEVARLTDTTDVGKEMWAYIPKNTLPYLKYLTDPDYCHLYYVDSTPYLFDASINMPSGCSGNYWNCARQTALDGFNNVDYIDTSWRTILVGSMRLGAACKPTTYAGNFGVKTPVTNIGYSSYFAIDVTDPLNPDLLWEFSDADLAPADLVDGGIGFSTSVPSIVKVHARKPAAGGTSDPDDTKNGRWFVVFTSGPTGPINTVTHEFMGYSDQHLKVFILDLAGPSAATWQSGTDYWVKDTGILNAFGGNLINATMDYDIDYQDDTLYFGYVKAESNLNNSEWIDGGVLRLNMRTDLNSATETATAVNAGNWDASIVIDNIGPVTAGTGHIARYPHTDIPTEGWIFFGTGKYFNKGDDINSQRQLFGVKDACVTPAGFSQTCTTPLTFCGNPVQAAGTATTTCGDITNVTTVVDLAKADLTAMKGWYINLESPTNTQVSGAVESNVTPTAERNITDPVATSLGIVFFTTFAPSADRCAFGGNTYLWCLEYNSGGEGCSKLRGTALLQVSSGAIEEIDLGSAFGEKFGKIGTHDDVTKQGDIQGIGRRTAAITGIPPIGQGLAIVVPNEPLNEVIQIEMQ